MNGPVRVALYTRISTDETTQPYSLGAQADRLEAFVSSQPDWRIVAHYTDQASAKSLDRPALVAVRRAAVGGEFDLLLVYRVDRLSRNVGQLVGLIEELAGHNVVFRSATEPFD
ncbi:MAG: recombinase family protein, partial [Candidatus Limnocylindrales bacterium]